MTRQRVKQLPLMSLSRGQEIEPSAQGKGLDLDRSRDNSAMQKAGRVYVGTNAGW